MKIVRKYAQDILHNNKRYTGEIFVMLDMETRFPKGVTDTTSCGLV